MSRSENVSKLINFQEFHRTGSLVLGGQGGGAAAEVGARDQDGAHLPVRAGRARARHQVRLVPGEGPGAGS